MSTDATPSSVLPSATPSKASPENLTGSQSVVRTLELLGVTDVFGLPGGAILPIYDAIMDSSVIRHILVRHEQGGGHAAEGYAVAANKVGVAMATSGPGATNLVTAIMDSVPVVFITGQVFSTLMGTDAFQEADIVGITMPITKHSFLVKKAEDIPAAIASAFEIAGSKKPVLYVGGGVIRARAAAELLALAETTGAPVVTTLMARGAFPDSHQQHLGMPGMHGTVPAVLALQEADLLVSLGARFDDRVTGKAALFAPNAQVIHVDIDPAEIGKIRAAEVPIVGDLKDVLVDLEAAYRTAAQTTKSDTAEWWSFLDGLRDEFPLGYTQPSDGLMSPQYVIQRIGELTGPEGVYAAGVGQHQMWSAQFIKYERPNSWLNSGGAGTMGYAVPAAMGAKVAEPDRHVWAIDGDGCFQMTNQELATCTINKIPIKVAIINNSSLGMVRQWQTLFYEGRYSNTDLNTGHDTIMVPDFVKLAEAYGCASFRVERDEDIDATIQKALEINDRPVVIDFVVSPDSMVWPMVPAGVSNDQIQVARNMTPDWEEED